MYKKITELTLQISQANAKLAEAQSSIATLTSKLSQTWTGPNRPPTIPSGPIDMTFMEKDGYCWIHGYKMQKGQKQGHMTEATIRNTIDGKMYCKGWEK